ncbi:hypothetical protein Pdsh_06595 [Pyrodictium delaneyi]|uniref:Uncharacterized protein n=1 Tax=Pyrodictium delaneyi TaxID=1273541 RepID=A0A211YNZ1_9CREN|nr:hypothetical protein Pdsh_06810 [Pyrodictium delaneyi]OWJ54681.1 hypothetical protein Pdsh_06595 [Pyrodictium delaneyi]
MLGWLGPVVVPAALPRRPSLRGPFRVKRRCTCKQCGRVLGRGSEYWLAGGRTLCPKCTRSLAARRLQEDLRQEYQRILRELEPQHWQRLKPEVFLTLLVHGLLPPLESDLYDDEKLTVMIRLLRYAREHPYADALRRLGETPEAIVDSFLSEKQWYINWKARHPLRAYR